VAQQHRQRVGVVDVTVRHQDGARSWTLWRRQVHSGVQHHANLWDEEPSALQRS
jgi:hypothetical protein